MHLSELLAATDVRAAGIEPSAVRNPGSDPEITMVTHDSRRVEPGALFCCIAGETTDGHRFVPDAERRGAVAYLAARPVASAAPQIVVDDPRVGMAHLAAAFHGHPSRDLDVVGVTGTNGKTSVVQILTHLLNHAGRPARALGTLSGVRTTPEAPDFQAALAEARHEGARAVVVEVSSHALVLHRVDGTTFALAGFTNLGRDHLDFHGTIERYFDAKAQLFTPQLTRRGVIRVDGPHGRLLADGAPVEVTRVSLDDLSDIEILPTEVRFRWRGHDVVAPLGGRYSVENAQLAAELARELGIDDETIVAGLADVPPVPGRFEVVDTESAATVVVDYAHTADGLEAVLGTAREVAEGRVLVVFGCGGDRDTTKRPMMGRVAETGADVVVVTSDNPRTESPGAIIDQIVAGMERPPAVVEPDRRAAIRAALEQAGPGDVVVLAGKGHETTQTIGGRQLPFDDRVVAVEVAAEVASGRSNR